MKTPVSRRTIVPVGLDGKRHSTDRFSIVTSAVMAGVIASGGAAATSRVAGTAPVGDFTFSAPLTSNFNGFSSVGAKWSIVNEEGGFARILYNGAGTAGTQLRYDFPQKTHREFFMEVELRQGGSEIACSKIFKAFGIRTNGGNTYSNVTLHGLYTDDACYGPAYGNAPTGPNDTQRSARFNGTSVDEGSPDAEYVYFRGSNLPLPRGSFGKWRFWWKQNTTPTSFDGECKVWTWSGSAWVLQLHRRNLKNRGDDSEPFDYSTLGDYTQSDETFWLDFRNYYISSVGFADAVPTLIGTGFGTNTKFAPLKVMTFEGLADGATWTQAGGSAWVNDIDGVNYTASFGINNEDGLPFGGGSWEQHVYGNTTNVGTGDGPFTHAAVYFPSTDTVTVFKHVKIQHVSGPAPEPGLAQYKGTRFMCQTGMQAAYQSFPKLSSSEYIENDKAYTTPHWWREDNAGGENNLAGARMDWITDGNWHCNFAQAKLNSADGVADGIYRQWWRGAYMGYSNTMDIRDSSTKLWQSIQVNPGLANKFCSTGEWIVRHARVVVLDGLAWVAFGNASTFDACSDLMVVEPTAWSNTQITFNARGIRPVGYNWMYVMKTDGTLVSNNGLTSFSGI